MLYCAHIAMVLVVGGLRTKVEIASVKHWLHLGNAAGWSGSLWRRNGLRKTFVNPGLLAQSTACYLQTVKLLNHNSLPSHDGFREKDKINLVVALTCEGTLPQRKW